jgi:drug/metabolite transporter (DMT)-like permease
MGITKANVFSNSIPVFTALFSFILLGDKLTFQNVAGMAIVIAGLLMSQLNGTKKIFNEALALTGKTA